MRRSRSYFLIVAALLVSGCRTNDNGHLSSANVEKPKNVPSPEPTKVAKSDSTPSIRIETLDDFEKSGFYVDYKMRKEDGWKLNNGSYNNSYETSALSDTSVEVQTIENKVVGFGMVFYERNGLEEADLNFVYKLLESIDTRATLESKTREYIKVNAEKHVFQIRQADPTTFGKFKVYAGKVGHEQIISIEVR